MPHFVVHDKHSLSVCVCVLSNIVYMGLSGLWSPMDSDSHSDSNSEIWILFVRPLVRVSVCPSVHLSAGGVPINCPNVQTSFVMRITKIEANHFANRILISNVSDSAVIRWIYTMEVEIQDSGFCLRLGNWVYRSPTIYVNFCVFAASGV